MDDPIYFTRMHFVKEYSGWEKYFRWDEILVLNLPARELSFQRECAYRNRNGAAIVGITSIPLGDKVVPVDFRMPARMISHQKTGFQPRMVREEDKWKVVFSHKINLTKADVQGLLPYCNARDFEPFRHRDMTLDDDVWTCYRDDYRRMFFYGFTDSYLPMIKLPMDLIYDEPRTWPSERLLQYIQRTFFINRKTKNQWMDL